MSEQVKPLAKPLARTRQRWAGWLSAWFSALPHLFKRRWLLSTLLVILAIGVTVRLGIWQLDRLETRRAFNSRVLAQQSRPTLVLNADALAEDLAAMEYRPVEVRGVYDPSQEVALRNQAWGNQVGVHLLTPLHITGTDLFVIVDRGWVPVDDFVSQNWNAYQERGEVVVSGVIRASQATPDFGRRADPTPVPGQQLKAWYFANVVAIGNQLPYEILPVYVQQAPSSEHQGLPYRIQPDLDLNEGPHQGYAIQWFTFAVIFLIGYPLLIHRRQQAIDTRSK